MVFDSSKTTAEALINESSDEEVLKIRPVSNALSADSEDEYKPLSYLKSAVKLRIFDLAQLNREQTVQLVETYLAEGDF